MTRVYVYTGDSRVLLDIKTFDASWAAAAFSADRRRAGYATRLDYDVEVDDGGMAEERARHP